MRGLKRALDRVAAALLLLLLSPLLAGIALWIVLDGGRPAVLAQDRAGKHGKPFRMLKYRTMVQDALDLAPKLTEDPYGVVENDPRITRPGRLLRRTGLDELPQLWNVLRGEMSLVGPRPERPSFVEEFRRRVPGYMLRHKVKAGITGWAQVNGWRGNTSIEKRIECDLYYIERWSLGFDLKILIQTLWYGFRNRNAY